MHISTITQKGQATIPIEIRHKLDLHTGDKLVFDIEDDKVIISRLAPFDAEYHKALAGTLSEWSSKEDDDAYSDL
jgi:AbrB family looped-hinge helix DNA binding protein